MSETGTGRPLIVPIFIPHQGCPHRCIYCHQERITSQSGLTLNPQQIREILEKALHSPGFHRGRGREVAFYGGTFTRLPLARMKAYLGAVNPYLEKDRFQSIRVSTRPDAMDPERLELMERFGVRTVELGVQSMNDEVLARSKRGHEAADSVRAVHLLREKGFRVGIQLMPGLPGDSKERFLATVEEVIRLRPDMVRLYPAIVIQGTEMARMLEEGRYRPLELEEAVEICRESCLRLEDQGIPVIRIGLQASPTLLEPGQILAGPWHEAFGFLVRSGIYHQRIGPLLPAPGRWAGFRIRVRGRDIPLVRGHGNRGILRIEEKTGAKVLGVLPDESLEPGRIEIDGIMEGIRSSSNLPQMG